MTTLRWLHFTDLHIGQRELKQGYWPSIKDAIHADLRRSSKELGPFDLVIFTGDLAFSGAREQYAELDTELDALWTIFAEAHPGAPRPVLLAVPGNHDLIRPEKHDLVAEQLAEKEHGRDSLWSGKDPQASTVRAWFGEYAAWWERRKPKDITPGLLPGDFAWTFEKDGLRFGFLGLNAAFLHVSGDVKEEQLWVDPRQILGACGGDPLAWAKGHDFAFLLTHHPPRWLAPEARSRLDELIAPADRFLAHFCGHLHDARVEQTRAGRGATREVWQGAALFGMEKARDGAIERRHGYTIGHLEIGEDGAASTRLWPRLAVKRQDGRWRITADVTHELEDDLLATPSAEAQPSRPIARVPSPAAAPPSPRAQTWREAVEQSALWPSADPYLVQARAIAAEIASASWERWQAADHEVPGDPWRDDDFPLRTLARLEALVPPGELGAPEIALLLAAPFLREGLFAAGAQWMALDLQQNKPDLARKILDEMRAARPDLVRRLERLTGPARDAVEHWLRTRALRQCPQLWEDRPQLRPAGDLVERAKRIAKDAGAPGWMLVDKLMQLVRHVGVSPEVFQAEESIDQVPIIEAGGVRLRLSALARLLSAAGAWALELRRAEDLVADHVGREGFEAAMAREAIRSARWVGEKDVHRLVQRCADPVVDFVLRDDLVTRADQVIRRLGQDRDARRDLCCKLLDRLPAQLRADITIEKGPDGRQRYQVPHVRFQLDHNRVRELLMGEQLYGDPSLAIRELYQNALDACRYRKARAEFLGPLYPYEGRIVFRQDVDEEGREYIECEDNGVGMTVGILEQVFAVAGKRFKDMPEYLEERARWDASGKKIELWPNSWFGIGVLSYFMLADEVKVWSRRFGPEGGLSDAVVAHISSASGLFRVEEGLPGVMAEGGTRVRVYLKKRTYWVPGHGEREVSCEVILGELLWVAEFATSVEETGKERLRWQAGVLSPGGKVAPLSRYLPTESPDVWWAACYHKLQDGGHNEDQPILVDGIATETMTSNALVNLRGGRCWALSVDRKRVQGWDRGWGGSVLRASLHRLLGWESLSMMFLWDLASHIDWLARPLLVLLAKQNSKLPLATRINKNFDTIPESSVRVAEVGVLSGDKDIPIEINKEPRNLFSAWRNHIWINSGAVAKPAEWTPQRHIKDMPSRMAEPGDDLILGRDRNPAFLYLTSSPRLVFSARDVFVVSLFLHRPVHEVIARAQAYDFLGFELDLAGADPIVLEVLRKRFEESSGELDDRNIGTLRWMSHEVTPINVFFLSLRCGLNLQDMACLLTPEDPQILTEIHVTADDLRVLPFLLNGRAPWATGEFSAMQLLDAARRLRMSVRSLAEAVDRFGPLGIRAPQIDLDRLDQLKSSERRLLSWNVDGEPLWLGSRVPVDHFVRVAEKLRISMAEARRRLDKLSSFGIVLPATDADTLDALEREEPQLHTVAKCFDEAGTPAGEIAAAAAVVKSVDYAIRLATRLGATVPAPLRVAFEALAPDFSPTYLAAAIIQCHEVAPGRDQSTRRRRGRAQARFQLWQISDEELDATIASLEPVIDYIIRQPKP